MNSENKYDLLIKIISKYPKAAVAYSGGCDSSFLLSVCALALGGGNVTAITAASETYTAEELEFAREFALSLGVNHIVLRTEELLDERFSSNPRDRCYHCKKEFYKKADLIIKSMQLPVIFDGSNADDLSDYRPGRKAAKELGVASPLCDACLTKNEIRSMSRNANLKSWDRESNPCLASRIPYGTRITAEKLSMVESAEKILRGYGFTSVRVRHHGDVARIELVPDMLKIFMAHDGREIISQKIKDLGFRWIAVDIDGYRTGSLNEALDVTGV